MYPTLPKLHWLAMRLGSTVMCWPVGNREWCSWCDLFLLLVILPATCQGVQDANSMKLCRDASSRQSCGECIKQDTQCLWCTDPAFSGDSRCDVETNMIHSCAPQFLYQAKSKAQLTENVEAGTYEPSLGHIRPIQPQQVHAFIKPGETVTFPFKYYHVPPEERDVYILNSETESQGVSLSYMVDCKGSLKRERACAGVRNADMIVYNVSVTARSCSSSAVVSIGLSGVRDVLALYVHPQCGCDCEKPEKQEPKSNHCSGIGTSVCGTCICDDPRRGGRHCECDLTAGQTAAQLEDSCRPEAHMPICSDRGYCNCGTCVCNNPQQYSGKFCECSYAPCPLSNTNGQPCGGHGTCHCGACVCDPGWTGTTCTCSTDTDDCIHDGKVCAGHGSCMCDACQCDEGYEGERCEQPVDSEEGDDGDEPDLEGTPHARPSAEQPESEMESTKDAGHAPQPEPTSTANSLSFTAQCFLINFLFVIFFNCFDRR